MIANLQKQFLTPEDYLTWEAEQQIRHEYIDGEVYAMAGGTLPHNDIAVKSGCRMPRYRLAMLEPISILMW